MRDARRYLLASLSVLAAIALVFGGLWWWQHERLNTASADAHLDTVRLTQRLVEAQDARDLDARAELIAGNQAVTGYIAEALGGALPGTNSDASSIIDLLKERRDQLGLAVAAVLDERGALLAGTGLLSGRRDFRGEPVVDSAKAAQALRTGLVLDGSRMLHVAVRPLLTYGGGTAYLMIGRPVDRAYAETIARIGASEIVLVAKTDDGPLALVTTLAADRQLAVQSEVVRQAGSAERRFDIDVDGVRYDATVAPLFGSGSASLVAMVAPASGMSSLAAPGLPIAIGGLLVLVTAGFALRRAWTDVYRPAGELLVVMDRAANAGDLHLTAPEQGGPLIRPLASAFNRLLARLS